MLRRTLCLIIGIAGLAGTILLLPGCSGGVDKTGPATAPQNMDANKQKQYQDFMMRKGRGGGGGGGNSQPVAPPPHG